ncbi:MAG: NAD-dependent epimerase/dehydratase family protein [Saprospiraceae bacterium]
MNSRILITGGSGLLGSYLLRWFRYKGYTQLTATYRDDGKVIPSDLRDGIEWKNLSLPDISDANEAVKNQDWVIHAAGLVSYNNADKFRLLKINKEGTKDIVNACLYHGVRHLVYIGSIAALGKEKNNITLDETTEWLQNEYSTPYGLSKYLGELEVWRGAAEGLNVSVLLPAIILGTGDWHRSSLQIIDRVANKAPWYPGGQTGFVDVRDVARFAEILLAKNLAGERWILNGMNLTYQEIYQRLAKEMGLQKKFRLAPKWLAGNLLMLTNMTKGRLSKSDLLDQVYGTFSYDASKSMNLEGFKYRSVEDTIQEVVNVYREGKGELSVISTS